MYHYKFPTMVNARNSEVETITLTKEVVLSLQFLDKREKDEPVLAMEEAAADYEV